jgi:hypothetical protein
MTPLEQAIADLRSDSAQEAFMAIADRLGADPKTTEELVERCLEDLEDEECHVVACCVHSLSEEQRTTLSGEAKPRLCEDWEAHYGY